MKRNDRCWNKKTDFAFFRLARACRVLSDRIDTNKFHPDWRHDQPGVVFALRKNKWRRKPLICNAPSVYLTTRVKPPVKSAEIHCITEQKL